MSKKILVIAPHADHEVLGVGGTIQKHIQLGDIVNVVIVCDRESTHDQRAFASSANKTLGVNDIKWLGFKDECVDNMMRDLIKRLEAVYDIMKPDVVYICNSDDINTDHQIIHRACVVVCRSIQDFPPRQVLVYEVPSSTTQSLPKTFQPNYYVSLTEDMINTKCEALYAYKCELREEPNPRNSRGLIVHAQYRGMECSAMYAEGFNLLYERR